MITLRHAHLDDGPAVAQLLARCQQYDGQAALSEFKELRVPVANAVRSLVAGDGDRITALGVAAWHAAEIGEVGGYWAAEVAIDPEVRSIEGYHAVLDALEGELGEMPSFWAFDEQQEQAARELGLKEVRAILKMDRSLPAEPPSIPDGVAVRAFTVGSDESLWLLLNERVFAHHPEAGSIDRADLALRMAQPWFDPRGLLILEAAGVAVGYCWTKLHSAKIGEIYMIGLVPEWRGRGLARPLTRAGLQHLADKGATRAMLYAEQANRAAVNLYERMGFRVTRRLSLFAA